MPYRASFLGMTDSNRHRPRFDPLLHTPSARPPSTTSFHLTFLSAEYRGDPEPARTDFIWLPGADQEPVGSERTGI